jgi:hypothetical protein
MSEQTTLQLVLDVADATAVADAMAVMARHDAMPDGNSDDSGALIAEICRSWLGRVQLDKRRGSGVAETALQSMRSSTFASAGDALKLAKQAHELAGAAVKLAGALADSATDDASTGETVGSSFAEVAMSLSEARERANDPPASDSLPLHVRVSDPPQYRECADCGYTYDERRIPWPARALCSKCSAGA